MTATNYAVAPGEYLEEWIDENDLSQQRVADLHLLLEAQAGGGEIRVVILVVEWQVTDVDVLEGETLSRQRSHGMAELPVERACAQAADDDADARRGHVAISRRGWRHHASRSAAATMSSSPGSTRNAAPASGV